MSEYLNTQFKSYALANGLKDDSLTSLVRRNIETTLSEDRQL